jgi:hypothetical protein
LEDATSLLPDPVERVPNRRLWRATHLELGYDPVDPLDVDVDGSAVITADSARERDIADLSGHLISKLIEAEALSRPARHRLAILLAHVGTLDVDHSRSMPDTGQ